MFQITLSELTKIVGGEPLLSCYSGDLKIRGVSIDSRNIDRENVFVAIPGEKFDGHQFVKDVSKKGVSAAVIRKDRAQKIKPEVQNSIPVLLVEDTKKALRDMASWYRKKFDVPTVAITGTNGKTTTKDMTAQVLSSRFKVLKSPKSYNNLIGVPLTLFQLDSQIEALVVELGMSSPDEIGILTRVADPHIGVITNIGPAHLESMQSVERITRAKFELLDNMSSPKTLILNADDPILSERIKQKKKNEQVISFSIQRKADFTADEIELNGNGNVSFRVNRDLTINLRLLGKHNVYNALAAFAVGRLKEVTPQQIKTSLERYKPSELRMELVHVGNVRVINDSYNANPISVQMALETVENIKVGGRKIAVLGDMLELGDEAADFHLKVGRKVAQSGIDLLLLVGELARFIGEGAVKAGMSSENVTKFENNQELSLFLLKNLKDGDLVLVKGSRKMRTEEVVFSLQSQYGRQN